LGIQANGEVAVPTTVHSVGWYDRGPAPGQFGSAVILGHVDSASKGIGTFYYLKNMKPNAAINVTLNDGLVAHFAVTKVVQYSKTAFPDRLVYGSSGTESLQLVTCGGSFDYSTGHYLANIVVFSHLVSVTGHLKK
jgi:sortase (surface protein transpeptidase)